MESNFPCPNCKLPVLTNFYFCPNCAKSLRPKPLSVSVGKQIGIYLLSVLLPPLGLWPAFKYLKQEDDKAKIVGLVAIVLTIISTIVTIYFAVGLFNQLNQQINQQLNGQLNMQLPENSLIPQQ